MRFFREVGQADPDREELNRRLISKASKLSMKRHEYVFAPPEISKTDFQNLGKTSKKFGDSQAYQYSDKASNQLNGRTDQN